MIFRFAGCEFDADRRTLTRGGLRVEVQPKVLDLLELMLRRPRLFISRDEARKAIWPQVLVVDHCLSQLVHKLRKAIGDNARAPRLIELRRGVGLRFAADVEPPRARAHASPASPASLLLERERELGLVSEALASVLSGAGRLLVVWGDAGIGKSSLVWGMVAQACELGFDAHLARTPRRGTLPFSAWCGVVARLIERWQGPDMLRALGPRAALLAQSASDPGNTRLQESEESAAARLGWMQAVADLLCFVSERTPVFLAIEDLHRADPDSVALLTLLVTRLEGARIGLAVSYREEEALDHPELSKALPRWLRPPLAVPLHLDGLSVDGVRCLIERESGAQASGGLARRIHRQTAGNPFLVAQLARACAEEGDDDLCAAGTGAVAASGPEELSSGGAQAAGSAPAAHAFGRYELHAHTLELRRDGRPVRIPRRSLELLLFLAQNRHRAVSRTELFARLWPSGRANDDALSQVVRKARSAVADNGKRQEVVRTVRMGGFQFVAPVRVIARPGAG